MKLRVLLVLMALLGLGLAPAVAVEAEDAPPAARKKDSKKRAARSRPTKQAAPTKKAEPKPANTRNTTPPKVVREPDAVKQRAQEAIRTSAQESGADSHIVKEGDTSVKVMTFSGLDIEGRLKSPQLLYFVHRVQTEFERPKLPHRSFMPELQRSTQREPLR